MDKLEFETKNKDLFVKWLAVRPDYELENCRFTEDGIADFDKWQVAKPKIMFLLKEDHSQDWEPTEGFSVSKTPFSKNVARWRQVIIEMYKNPDFVPEFDTLEYQSSFDDMAIVEIKKKNEGKGTSNYTEIKEYAIRDKDFIREQIDLIDPQVIICAKTLDLYGDAIYGDDSWEQLIAINGREIYKHRNRIVISMNHPSTRSKALDRDHFNTLVKMIFESKAFGRYKW